MGGSGPGCVFALEHFQEQRRFGESSTGRGSKELIGIVRRELPASRATHRKPANGNALIIDGNAALQVIDQFQNIDFSGEFKRVAIAAVWMGDDGGLGHRFVARSVTIWMVAVFV